MQHFVICSAQGQPEPTWPEVTSLWQDVLSPLFRFVGLGLVCAGPALVLLVGAFRGQAWAGLLLPGAIVLAGLYLPMAFLAVSMFDSLAAVNPLLIVPSLLKVPLQYLLVLVAFFMAGLAKFGGHALLDLLMPVPVLPSVLATGLGFYFLAVQTRLLGLLYACHKERLGWFG